MSACAMLTYNNVTRNALTCIQQAAYDQYHVTVTGDNGCATDQGFTICWNYNESTQKLSIQCTDSPWWAPCSAINSKINDVVTPCLSRHGVIISGDMCDIKIESPDHVAQMLAANPKLIGISSSNQKVCFGPTNNGWFKLYWSATAINERDWVGLYINPEQPDSNYIRDNNWQWAKNGDNYVTSTACQPGYEARYLTWDVLSNQYKSIARTGAYPEKVCSA